MVVIHILHKYVFFLRFLSDIEGACSRSRVKPEGVVGTKYIFKGEGFLFLLCAFIIRSHLY